MPPKDTKPHELFLSADNGKTYEPFGIMTDASLIDDGLVSERETELPIFTDNEMVIPCKVRLDISMMIFLVTGKYPSNNWLKMHGYPMRRKRNGGYAWIYVGDGLNMDAAIGKAQKEGKQTTDDNTRKPRETVDGKRSCIYR